MDNLHSTSKKELFNIIQYFLTGEEFWIGLENIYQLTNIGSYTLRVTLKDFERPEKVSATYKNFRLTENVNYFRRLEKSRISILTV
jgi:hypothetical protein